MWPSCRSVSRRRLRRSRAFVCSSASAAPAASACRWDPAAALALRHNGELRLGLNDCDGCWVSTAQSVRVVSRWLDTCGAV